MSTNDDNEKVKDSKLNKLLNVDVGFLGESAGGVVGAGVGFIIGGPFGAIVGGASGPIVSKALRVVGREFSNRYLSKREEVRVCGVLVFAATEIDRRIKNGEDIRQDGLFDQDSTGRSYAEEIVENVILKCQKDPQERKIPFMGYMLANLVFRSDIGADMAHQIINLADVLTFRQLCLLRIAARTDTFHLRESDYREQERFSKDLYQVLHECLDLYHKALVNFGGEVAFGITDVFPSRMSTQGIGADIYSLMQLCQISDEELMPIAHKLK